MCESDLHTITGMDLCRYNRWETPTEDTLVQQAVLNESVQMVKNLIIRRNSELGLATPWLQRLVHRYNNGKVTNSYTRLDWDGCHLWEMISSYWARELNTTIMKNMENMGKHG